jgi:hypothetical protein
MKATGVMGVVVGVGLSAGSVALGQLHASDIVLTLDGGAIGTNVIEEGGNAVVRSRVFLGTFGEFDFANDPGFDSQSGTFAAGSRIGFDLLGPVETWNGSAFALQSGAPRIRARFGANERLTPEVAGQVVAGFGISVASNGEFHRHVGYTLLSQAMPPASPAESGVYLMKFRLWSNQAGVLPSDELFLVWNQGVDEVTHRAAGQWVLDEISVPGCAGDVGGEGGAEGSDGLLDNNDFVVFIQWFFAGDERADVGGEGGAEVRDGAFDNNDFVVFINRFFAGC